MAGASANHNLIVSNVHGLIFPAIDDLNFVLFMSDMRLSIPHTNLYTYADLVVVAGEPSFPDERDDTITNPCLIVEVLSASTRDYDRGNTFAHYRTIPSFREYLVIDQYAISVEHWFVSQQSWERKAYNTPDSIVALRSIPVQLPVARVYKRVKNDAGTPILGNQGKING